MPKRWYRLQKQSSEEVPRKKKNSSSLSFPEKMQFSSDSKASLGKEFIPVG